MLDFGLCMDTLVHDVAQKPMIFLKPLADAGDKKIREK